MNARYALLVSGQIAQLLYGDETLEIEGVRYALPALTAEERASLGIVPVIDDPRPDERWHTGIAAAHEIQGDHVRKTWTATYDRAAHVVMRQLENRMEAIRRIDADEVTGNDRAKLTLLAAAIADIIVKLVAHDASFAPLMAHLAPWQQVIALQTKEAAINAQLQADPTLNLVEAWQA